MNTKKWLERLPEKYQDAFYENLEGMKTHELWEWIIYLLPLEQAKGLLEGLTQHWKEDEIGEPYNPRRKNK